MGCARPLAGLIVALACAAAPAAAEAALDWKPCGGLECAHVSVPLDRSGAVSGTVRLSVQRLFGRPRPRSGVALLLGGEPGQAAAPSFTEPTGFDGDGRLGEWRDLLFNARLDPVVFEARGTGRSAALRCRDLERATPIDAAREAAACAALLGSRRGLYGTADTVADIEDVRVALGVERLTLIGVSYGAYVAQRYALSHPARVTRLVLDSPVDAAGLDPLSMDTVAAARRVLPLLCARGCRGTRLDPLADTERLMARLTRVALQGAVVGADGRPRPATLSAQELLATLVATSGNPIAQARYPAAVASALRGDPAPLMRLKRSALVAGRGLPARVHSAAAHAATLCEEVSFPWAWNASSAERAYVTGVVEAGLAPALTRPFAPAALTRSELMRLCRLWPTASPGPPPAPGPLPDVPALVLAGERDLQTPLETARRVAARFARSELVVAPHAGHGILSSEHHCAASSLSRFLAGRPVRGRCRRPDPPLAAAPPAPRSLAELAPARGVRGTRGRLMRAVLLTMLDAFEQLVAHPSFQAGESSVRTTGLRGGTFVVGRDRLILRRLELVPGVRVSASGFNETNENPRIRVDGPGRLDGWLRFVDVEDDEQVLRMRGRLGGRRVMGRMAYSFLGGDAEGGAARAAAVMR